ncbi:unnamed protein product [Spirodela intermedia]|uniref:EF-hand domain-containing protein n=1 Tax=Spirodela intermedia TaxID=51605 RepID=A0A7I8JD74_SPIIN|nr:unnamed protein product [Spirodela intermedia]CAA6668116.1 unnamed protein product [Spirodela intermedia]
METKPPAPLPWSSSSSSGEKDSPGRQEQEQQKQPPSGCCNPVKKPGPISMEHVLLALRETVEEREVRIRSLFDFFDAAGAGHLDQAQIEAGLSALNIPAEYKYARDLLKVCDANRDGRVDYREFRWYMDEKELELYRIFQAIDVEHSGASFRRRIEINDEELARFVEHVDKDNDGIITFDEWRDFLLLYPHEVTIENIYRYWERVCLVDIGEQAVIPEGISKHLDASKYLIAGDAVASANSKGKYNPAIKDIWKEGRLLGFFRGNGLNVVKVTPESAIKFYTFEMLKGVIVNLRGEDMSDIGASGRLIAGGLAGAVAQTAIYPIDLIKTRLQTHPNIWLQEGPRAFYRGLIPSLLGIVPYAGIDLAAYETLKDLSRTYILENSEPGPLVQLGCGTISGALGATCVYPLQVIRTRMQAQPTNAEAAYTGMGDVFWRTYRKEGFRGFYKGIFPNLLKVVPAASITYLVYESMKKNFALD